LGTNPMGATMKSYVQYHLDDGSVVVAEVEQTEAEHALERVARPKRVDDVVIESANRLEAVGDVIGPTAEAVFKQIRQLQARPEEVEVEFAVKLTVAAGVVIASTGAEGTIKVVMRWKSDGPDAN
jgi:2-keto-3-deoxy-L-rhamnonate aldolase RhmA